MKVRTIDQLLDRIGSERVWRIREIAALRSQCFSTSIPVDAQRALRRSFLPIAYAHWEGFVTKTSHYYLEYIAMQRLTLSELNWPFVSLYLLKEYNRKISASGSYALEDVCRAVILRANDRVRLQYKDVISTRANLNSEVLRDICRSLGLEYTEFQAKELFIDAGLLGKRNHIAHGEAQDIDKDEIESVKTEVVGLIDCFRNKIENAALNSQYRMPVA